MEDEIIKSHNFDISAGRIIKQGKAFWPDCLNLFIPRHRALDMAIQLLRQIENNDEQIYLSFMGKLEYDINEEE